MLGKLRLLRLEHGMSLGEVAEKIGISAGYMSQIESGKRHMSAEVANQIAELYNTDRDELFEATRYKTIDVSR
ncbi:helix-turn-helix domain-containing protein [Shouchella lonarensis]|uniref:Putative transcriptional regulator n=1 Tax=Shouchella lonarensis TaxID=1464122 RepID=A0A1G6IWS3_9BACI|nr:helix-turn-helix transcriptional regulator [Shouchella lonarensis]SDC10535.1 putative transcriptional regulator [Shouchella lonarensis]